MDQWRTAETKYGQRIGGMTGESRTRTKTSGRVEGVWEWRILDDVEW